MKEIIKQNNKWKRDYVKQGCQLMSSEKILNCFKYIKLF